MDQWFEEDEQVFVHARDPYHRVDVVPTSRHIQVSVGGEIVAGANALFETGLPTRWYVPPLDVRRDMLEPSERATRCPYKGVAGYWSVRTASGLAEELAWTYPDPLPSVAGIAGQLVLRPRSSVDIRRAKGRPDTDAACAHIGAYGRRRGHSPRGGGSPRHATESGRALQPPDAIETSGVEH